MRDSDTKEFVATLTRHSRRIYSFIRALVPNQADADDLFQDVSITLWEKYGSFRKDTDFRAWAFQIAHYKILNFRQRKANAAKIFTDKLIEQLAGDRLALDDSLGARSVALADCYLKLDAFDRQLLDLRYGEDATVQDVATQTGRSVDFVYKSLRRIHGILYRCIQETIDGDGNS